MIYFQNKNHFIIINIHFSESKNNNLFLKHKLLTSISEEFSYLMVFYEILQFSYRWKLSQKFKTYKIQQKYFQLDKNLWG